MAPRTIADRYRLVRELGRGGTATVHLAVDEKHGRDVALKVLRPDLAAAVGAERFLREIEITARLNHPHILPLLDSGSEDGVLYYVMPHVPDGSLRLLLERPIPTEAVIRIVGEVAAALDHAHARGVIHRDIKPENILFNDGLAVVADFGIARAVGHAGETRVTGTGLSVGTLGYMSPEQALGAEELDARSDVYSLGAVAFEMLVGATPASWPGTEDVRLGRFDELPPDQRERLDALPGRIEQTLVRALALRPQHRFASPGQLAESLRAAVDSRARFTDDQVRSLLRRAAEIQQATPDPPQAALTIGAVEQIAAQVGIPPAHVREAAREMESPGPSDGTGSRPAPRSNGAVSGDWRRLRGDRWDRLVATAVVDGTVPDAAFPALVAEIQRRLGIAGHASIVGGSLTWSPASHGENTRRIVVQVTPIEGQTRIRVQEDLEIQGAQRAALPVGGLFGATLGAAIGNGLALADPAVGVAILACAGAGVLAAVRAVVGFRATDRAPELEEMAEALAGLSRAVTSAGVGSLPPSAPTPRP